jgi:hypothetical protein
MNAVLAALLSLLDGIIAWGDLGWVAGLLLILLLAGKELVRAYGGPATGRWMRRFNAVSVPLMIVFGVAVLVRIFPLLAGG